MPITLGVGGDDDGHLLELSMGWNVHSQDVSFLLLCQGHSLLEALTILFHGQQDLFPWVRRKIILLACLDSIYILLVLDNSVFQDF